MIDEWHPFLTAATAVEQSFYNYIVFDCISPEANTRSALIKTHGSAQVGALTIFDDSGIVVTIWSPPKIALNVTSQQTKITLGQAVQSKFTVKNEGDIPARNTVVGINLPSNEVSILGDNRVSLLEVRSPTRLIQAPTSKIRALRTILLYATQQCSTAINRWRDPRKAIEGDLSLLGSPGDQVLGNVFRPQLQRGVLDIEKTEWSV